MTLLLQELVSFQERIYQKDPVRAKARRRLVMGLREVTKHMKLNKIKCVIISPNCEKIQSKGVYACFRKVYHVGNINQLQWRLYLYLQCSYETY